MNKSTTTGILSSKSKPAPIQKLQCLQLIHCITMFHSLNMESTTSSLLLNFFFTREFARLFLLDFKLLCDSLNSPSPDCNWPAHIYSIMPYWMKRQIVFDNANQGLGYFVINCTFLSKGTPHPQELNYLLCNWFFSIIVITVDTVSSSPPSA